MNSKPPERLRLDRLATPIGEALIVTDRPDSFEHSIGPIANRHDPSTSSALWLRRAGTGGRARQLRRLLRNYFDGDFGCLRAIEWRTAGTPFHAPFGPL